MEENGSEHDLAAPAAALEDNSDEILSRLFGGTLQAATIRLVIYLVILCAIAATAATVV